MAKKTTKAPSFFDLFAEVKDKPSDKIELNKSVVKQEPVILVKTKPIAPVYKAENILTEEQRRKLFPNKPLTLRQLKAKKNGPKN